MMFPELPPRLRTFLFLRTSATGFGAMRIAWSLTVLFAFLFQWGDVLRLYSDVGMFPLHTLSPQGPFHDTLFSIVLSPGPVFAVYLLFLCSLLLSALGIAPRCTVMLSFFLLLSFHERNPFISGGGDMLLRLIGFLLMISPELRACSLPRLLDGRARLRRGEVPSAPLTMSIWPYRLLLWQMIVLYGSSLWHKLLGTTWLGGTAVVFALHHPAFSYLPPAIVDAWTPFLTPVNYAVLLFHAGWLLLLTPHSLVQRLFPSLREYSLKRGLLLLGMLFHGAIAVTMVTGTFPFAIFTAYAGLLLDADWKALRRWRRMMGGENVVRLGEHGTRETRAGSLCALCLHPHCP